ncbi:hypothetical protein SDC9_117975 [bioreactor metagenome]|uniref:Lipid IV(A) 4-amino-4-deoxy-L-arabinosyltransferase n=1 Tax=bioreactor metagenome TaxID=1076179 RepID=A0A645C081_9ZZZZ
MPFVVIAPHLLTGKRWLKHLNVSNFTAFIIAAGLYFLPFYLASVIPLEAPFRAQGNELSGLELVWKENIVRVFNAFDHKDPFYSYLYNLPRTLLPWAPAIILAIAGMVRNWKRLPAEVRELMIGTLAMFVLFCCSTSRRWYYILPVMPFCAILASAALCRGFSVEKWDRPMWYLMRILVIIAASLGIASLVGIPLWHNFFDFSLPPLMLISLPVAGALVLGVILADNLPESPVERWTGMPRRLGATVLGWAILVVCMFACVLPSTTLYRTEKQLYTALQKAELDIPPERMFVWRDDAPPKMLFYLDLRRPVPASLPGKYEQNRDDLRDFAARNAGSQVMILSYDRKSDLKPLAAAVAELGLPLDTNAPDFSERNYDVVPNKSRRRFVWIVRLPQTTEENKK